MKPYLKFVRTDTQMDEQAQSNMTLYFFKVGGINMMNMINFLFPLTDITFQNHLSQQQGICGLVILTLWHITAQKLQIFQIFH